MSSHRLTRPTPWWIPPLMAALAAVVGFVCLDAARTGDKLLATVAGTVALACGLMCWSSIVARRWEREGRPAWGGRRE